MNITPFYYQIHLACVNEIDASPKNYVDDSINELMKDMNHSHIKSLIEYGEYITNPEKRNGTQKPDLKQRIILNNSLMALYESKIINLWKTIEIKIKEIAEIAYGANTDSFYIWNVVKAYFAEKNIVFGDIKHYREINRLRLVNNTIKHQGLVWTGDINFDEFKREKNHPYHNDVIVLPMVQSYYARVKKYVYPFLEDLKSRVLSERFDMTDDKMQELAIEIAKRMNYNDALKFANTFLKLYNLESKIDATPL